MIFPLFFGQTRKNLHLPPSSFPFLSLCLSVWVYAILKDVQVVGGGYGDYILRRVPRHVQDFLGEVQAVHAHVASTTFTTGIHAPSPQHSPRLAALPPGLQRHTSPRLPIEHPEEAVVGTRHDHARGSEK